MKQVICPGCAKLIEVGELPEGTLPACPYCRTVFQVAAPSPAASAPGPASAAPSAGASSSAGSPSAASSSTASSADDAGVSSRRAWLSGFVLVLVGALLAMLLLLAVTLLAHREKERQDRDGPRNAAGWQTVGRFSGHTHATTALFRVASPVWRITWSCSAYETPAKKHFQVRVMDDRGNLVGTPINSPGDEGETTMVETEPGMYLLEVRAANVEWVLTVEHQP